jgi:hypothetical protein
VVQVAVVLVVKLTLLLMEKLALQILVGAAVVDLTTLITAVAVDRALL